MRKVPGLDYEFDRGVYTKETIDMDRFFGVMKKIFYEGDDDLRYLFEVPELYQAIGKHIESKYDSGELGFVGIGDKDVGEVGVQFRIGNETYMGFIAIDEKTYKIFERYDKNKQSNQ